MSFNGKAIAGFVLICAIAGLVSHKTYSLYQQYRDSTASEYARIETIAKDIESGKGGYSNQQIADLLKLAYSKDAEKYLLRSFAWITIGSVWYGMLAFFIGAFLQRNTYF